MKELKINKNKKRSPSNERVYPKVICSECNNGKNCPHVKRRLLNDMDTEFCMEHLHIISYKKIDDET